MMLDLPHTSAPMLMRGNTPPTTRSPPHQSRPAGYPPNRQPATVGEEERGWRGTTSRRTSTRAAPDRRPPPTAPPSAGSHRPITGHHRPITGRHRPPPRTSTSTLPNDNTQSTLTPLQTTHTAGNPHTGDGQRLEDARRQPRMSPQQWPPADARTVICALARGREPVSRLPNSTTLCQVPARDFVAARGPREDRDSASFDDNWILKVPYNFCSCQHCL